MAQSYPDVSLSATWQDIAALPGFGAIANQKVTLQAKGVRRVLVYIGGAAAPVGDQGVSLLPDRSVTGTSDHFWVKGSGTSVIAVLVED